MAFRLFWTSMVFMLAGALLGAFNAGHSDTVETVALGSFFVGGALLVLAALVGIWVEMP